MAKLKAARPKSKQAPKALGAVPCVVVLIAGMALLTLLFYLILKPS
ncbi:MAG: hypothetical protein ABSG25_11500 [Bryobacteraceae bacterium]|jgi:hypothetical protein